jgi:hypothetical protein
MPYADEELDALWGSPSAREPLGQGPLLAFPGSDRASRERSGIFCFPGEETEPFLLSRE